MREYSKIVELEEELRVVGNNLKSLELSEEKALEKEDIFAEQIRQLDYRLKEVWPPSYSDVWAMWSASNLRHTVVSGRHITISASFQITYKSFMVALPLIGL